ncbi:MAG: hydrogenase maturation nickel metallochaperone HypA [Pseudomonadota bacterium]
MHELSVAQALVEAVEGLIEQHAARAASRIRVRIGPLAGVVPELLTSAFPLAAAGHRCAQAELELTAAPIRVRCQTCGAESEAAINRLLCAACGDWHTQVVSGDELLLESVELDLQEAAVGVLNSESTA